MENGICHRGIRPTRGSVVVPSNFAPTTSCQLPADQASASDLKPLAQRSKNSTVVQHLADNTTTGCREIERVSN